jgi:hypothetical protein
MVSYCTPDGSNYIPEMLQEDIETFLSNIKVISSISKNSSTFPEVFIFQTCAQELLQLP